MVSRFHGARVWLGLLFAAVMFGPVVVVHAGAPPVSDAYAPGEEAGYDGVWWTPDVAAAAGTDFCFYGWYSVDPDAGALAFAWHRSSYWTLEIGEALGSGDVLCVALPVQQADYEWTEAGWWAFCVALVVTDDEGLSDDDVQCIQVWAQPVAVASAVPGEVAVGEPVAFSAAGSASPWDEELSYSWTFTGGGTAFGADVSMAFADPGTACGWLAVAGAFQDAVDSVSVCVEVHDRYVLTLASKKPVYAMDEEARLVATVEDSKGPVSAVLVSFEVVYTSGDPAVDAALDALGPCRTWLGQATTDALGRAGVDVPPALATRCLGGPRLLEAPTLLEGSRYDATADATDPRGVTSHASVSYLVEARLAD